MTNITFPVDIKKARVELFLGPELQDTYIAVDGKPMPYRSLLIYQEYGRTVFLLERVVDDSGHVSEETVDKPIREVIEASPLVIRQSKEGLVWSPDSIIND